MKKIVDAGALRSPDLEKFLKNSPENFAVITDYALMESLKGNVELSLKTISNYPDQVVVLKSTYEITKLKPKRSGIHSRFKDTRQTKGFSAFCNTIKNNKGEDADIAFKSFYSNQHFARLEKSAEIIRNGIDITANSYSKEDLYRLHSNKPFSEQFIKRITRDIFQITIIHFRDASGFKKVPSVSQAYYSFPFRYAVCCHALTIRWISERGYQNVANKKIKNDFTDMTYAAYATFYDGLLTKDKKLAEVYQTSKWMLSNMFHGMAEVNV